MIQYVKGEGTDVGMNQNNKKRTASNSDKLIWDLAFRRLEKELSDRNAKKWLEELSFVGIQGETAVLIQFRIPPEESCISSLEKAFTWAAGRNIQVKLQNEFPEKKTNRRKAKKDGKKISIKRIAAAGVILVCLAGAAFFMAAVFLKPLHFEKVFYHIASSKVDGSIRLVQLSDLEGTPYGTDNSELIENITLLDPDLIIFSGNMVEESQEYMLKLCQELSEAAEICYTFGENEKIFEADYRQKLEAEGVHVLTNEEYSVNLEENTIDLFGVESQENLADQNPLEEEVLQNFLTENPEHFKIMISSTPDIYSDEELVDGLDLMLAGGTLSGRYALSTGSLIVSRGLTKKNVWRIGNPPELVIIDISRY